METLTKDTTVDELNQEVKSGKSILFFTAGWCPDCRFIKPFMPEIEDEYSDYKFIEVDRDDNLDLAIEFNIFGIPSFIAFEDGKETGRYVNKDRKTKLEVENFINGLNS